MRHAAGRRKNTPDQGAFLDGAKRDAELVDAAGIKIRRPAVAATKVQVIVCFCVKIMPIAG